MCGICGVLNKKKQLDDIALIKTMTRQLEKRGPDHEGSFHDSRMMLGHRRLAIIDLSSRSNQPLIDPILNHALVFNGTIYNYKELKQTLHQKGYQFFTEGDSEVIIKAYHYWGQDCVKHLHGMFAFAIWSMKDKTLFLARDRLGIKPLYFTNDSQRFMFASNTRALLSTGLINTEIDPIALHHQLTLHAVIPAPRTILKGIKKVKPGYSMLITAAGDINEQRYWSLSAVRPEQNISQPEWIEKIRADLKFAVNKRLEISDVPVGVLLSGGLDSSLLVALLAQSKHQSINTFSVGFEDQPEEMGNEFFYSDQVVAQYKTQHHKFNIHNKDVLKRLPEAIQHMAEPMVGQDAIAFYLLAEQVSKVVKVVQSGQGADEVFAGYFWYPRMHQAKGTYLERFKNHYFDRDHEEFLQTVTPTFHGNDHTSAFIQQALNQPHADTFMDQVLRLDITTLIVDDPVKRVDNMTMAWGLESRVPFLDHKVVETAAMMPPELKLKGDGKFPLKMIARGIVPDAIIDRPKGYFPVPALKYVRSDFLDFMRNILTSKACKERDIFQTDYIEKLLNQPDQYFTRLNGSKLWHLSLVELWFQINVDNTDYHHLV